MRAIVKLVAVTPALWLAATTLAAAPQFPPMRAGLWQVTTASRPADGAPPAPPRTTTICLDASVQQQMMQFSQGVMRGLCSRNDIRVDGTTVTGDAECQIGGSRAVTHSVMKFNGDTGYHTEAHAVYDPPLLGRASADSIIDGRLTGPCPAGVAPGDMQLPDGKTINLRTITNTP
ncbi:MAG TPA: DUF3617 family protein [Casimicrobiaceae bacterium]|nr:DUF3617 family protein [Casimicrobiaceae bacterium]